MAARSLRVLSHLPVGLLSRIREELPTVSLDQIPHSGEIPPGVRGDVLLTFAWGSPNLAEVLARGVRWVHAFGTGVERFPFEQLAGRTLTCSRGASAVPISEWVLAALLAAEKKLPETWQLRGPQDWGFRSLGGLEGRELGLIGFGGIGQAVAARALPFGMRVRALVRRPRESPMPGVLLTGELASVMASADHLVLAAPDTRETHHIVGRESLARVKPGLHLVNVARGGLVDQDALREALADGRVALASLDTVTPEPLPEGHWLYTHPRVRLSPHTSWASPSAMPRLVEPFLANLRHDLLGEPLEFAVDVEAGY
jgi:phosphoglycerate dehydrogenase-like enzyme